MNIRTLLRRRPRTLADIREQCGVVRTTNSSEPGYFIAYAEWRGELNEFHLEGHCDDPAARILSRTPTRFLA